MRALLEGATATDGQVQMMGLMGRPVAIYGSSRAIAIWRTVCRNRSVRMQLYQKGRGRGQAVGLPCPVRHANLPLHGCSKAHPDLYRQTLCPQHVFQCRQQLQYKSLLCSVAHQPHSK